MKTVQKAVDWCHVARATVRFHTVEQSDPEAGTEQINVVTVTVPGKTGCKVVRRRFLEAVAAAYEECKTAQQNVFGQLDLGLVEGGEG